MRLLLLEKLHWEHSGLVGCTHCVVWLNEGIVASNNLDVAVLNAVSRSAGQQALSCLHYLRIAEDDATNAAEAIDTDLHPSVSLFSPSRRMCPKLLL